VSGRRPASSTAGYVRSLILPELNVNIITSGALACLRPVGRNDPALKCRGRRANLLLVARPDPR
jgi:hypothetical protein